MPLEDIESAGKYISDLVVTNPESTDYPGQDGDNHLRGIKNVVVNTFPNLSGPVTSTQAELNLLDGKTSVATLGANTFTAGQSISESGVNCHLWYRDPDNGDLQRGLLYWDRATDSMNLRQYNLSAVTVAQLNFSTAGNVNCNIGQLQQNGVDVAVNRWYGSQAHVTTAKTGINGNLIVLTSTNCNFNDEYDSYGWFTPTSGRFTPTLAGYYRVHFNVNASSTGTSVVTSYIEKNAAPLSVSADLESTGFAYHSHSVVVYMNGTTDYITFDVYCADSSWTLGTLTTASVTFLGE
jgi:hypothetical protein